MANGILAENVDVGKDDTLPCANALKAIQEIVPSGWFILERSQEVVMNSIDNLNDDLLGNATSIRAFSQSTEIRLEREFGENEFRQRVLKAGSGDQLHYQDHSYLLAKTNTIKIVNGGSGLSLLKCREYFRIDEDGMAYPAFERLIGVDIKPAAKEERS